MARASSPSYIPFSLSPKGQLYNNTKKAACQEQRTKIIDFFHALALIAPSLSGTGEDKPLPGPLQDPRKHARERLSRAGCSCNRHGQEAQGKREQLRAEQLRAAAVDFIKARANTKRARKQKMAATARKIITKSADIIALFAV